MLFSTKPLSFYNKCFQESLPWGFMQNSHLRSHIIYIFELPSSVISYDLISAFDEILQMGRDQEVDFVLLGGDLFHDNRPTRNAEHQCMKILKKHVLGDR